MGVKNHAYTRSSPYTAVAYLLIKNKDNSLMF
jgi:hypothetical protein